MEFYRCEHCGNIVAFLNKSGVPVVCCGEKMKLLEPAWWTPRWKSTCRWWL